MSEYGRQELLYDPDVIEELEAKYKNAHEIKRQVDTDAFEQEIRAAIHYWRRTHVPHDFDYSQMVYDRCECVDQGNLALDGNELVYGGELSA